MMRQTYRHLTAKGFLAALISYTLSGHAVADIAGRVNFVSGTVQAVSADGTRRTLVKGELVNSGERLETLSGRMQIRFTDGSFISLQPNTVFSLDKYTFNKASPNEGALLFNFIRGGMRAVSGAIGKANRSNYKVQTPVATIGIRGTSYAANQEPNGKLLLTVGSGMVNLENSFGSSNVNVGQTFQVNTGQAPNVAPAGVSVSARADKPDSTSQKEDKKEDKKEVTDTKKPDTAVGDQVNNDGSPLFQRFIQLHNGLPRVSSFGSLLKGSSESNIYPNIIGLYSELSDNGQQVGNLEGLIGTEFTGGASGGKILLDTRKIVGGLQFANVKQINSLSFGEWTNGTAKTIDAYIGTPQQLTLSNKQFMPYIVGTTGEKVLGQNNKVSYVLAGATPLRAGTEAGTLTKLNIDIDLNLMPLVSVDMAATLRNINYTASLKNHAILDISGDKKFSGFILPGKDIGFYATSSTASICANNKCAVDLSAFLSSNDLGVVYEINRTGLSTLGGVAALKGTESTITPTINANTRLESSLEGQYTALFKDDVGLNLAPASKLAAAFDSSSQGLLSAFHVTGSGDNLTASDFYGALRAADATAADIKDIGHVAKVLSWGRWTNGRIAAGNDEQGGRLLGANSNVHYLIGLPTPASAMPNVGSVSYQLAGGTSTALFGTASGSSPDVGRLNNGSLSINFANASANLQLGINGFSKAGNLQSIGLTGAGTISTNQINFTNLSVSANSNQQALVCTACSANANGLFFGQVMPVSNITAPTAVGLNYSITGTVQGTQATSVNINGTAAFANPTTNNGG